MYSFTAHLRDKHLPVVSCSQSATGRMLVITGDMKLPVQIGHRSAESLHSSPKTAVCVFPSFGATFRDTFQTKDLLGTACLTRDINPSWEEVVLSG